MRLTKHAAIRLQQRGIPLSALDCVMLFGNPVPAPGGAIRYTFTNRSFVEAEHHLKSLLQNLHAMKNRSLIIDADLGTCITAY